MNKMSTKKPEGPIKLRGANIEHIRASNTFIGTGFVDIVYGDMHLQAEYVKLNVDTGDLFARGSVILDDPNGRLTGEKIFYNINTSTGKILSGEGFMKPNYYFSGEVIKRISKDRFIVEKGYYTPCSQPVPDWKLGLSKADISLEGYAHIQNFTFRINDFPIMYFPYAVFPAKTKRASGLLRPKIGYSAWRGTELAQPYYWNINKWSDATFMLDYKSNMGVGGSAEYRYRYTKNDWGKFYGYLFQEIDKSLPDNVGSQQAEDRKRWTVYADVVHHLPSDIRTISHFERYSDKDFPGVFSDRIQDRMLREEDKYFFADKNTDTSSLSIMGRHIRDMQPGNSLVLQKAPELRWDMMDIPIFKTPLYLRTEALYTFYLRDNKFDPDTNAALPTPRNSDYRVQRFFINPEISMPISMPFGATLNPRVGYMGTLYSRSGESKNLFERHIFRFDADLSGPTLYSVFNVDGFVKNLKKIQHIIEPRVSYHYVPHSRQDNLFHFIDNYAANPQSVFRIDNLDYIPQQNFVRLSLRNFFNGRIEKVKKGKKGKKELRTTYKKLAELNLGADLNFVDYDFENYDLNEALRVTGRDSNPAYSYLYSSLEFNLFPSFKLGADIHFNLDKDQLETYNVDLSYKSELLSFNAYYRHTIDIVSTPKIADLIQDENDFLTGDINVSLTKSWSVTVSSVFNLGFSSALETRVGLNYSSQCWGVNFLYIKRNNDNNEFHLLFNLLTLGPIGL